MGILGKPWPLENFRGPQKTRPRARVFVGSLAQCPGMGRLTVATYSGTLPSYTPIQVPLGSFTPVEIAMVGQSDSQAHLP